MTTTDQPEPEQNFLDLLTGIDGMDGDAQRVAQLVLAGTRTEDEGARWHALAAAAERFGLRERWLSALAERAAGSAEASLHAQWAHALLASGDGDGGQKALGRALELSSDTLIWRVELAMQHLEAERFDSALTEFAVLEADPRIVADADDAAWIRTAQTATLAALGRYDEAAAVARARDDGALAPDNPTLRALCRRASNVLIEAGRVADALSIVERVLTPNVMGEARAALLFDKARALFPLGQAVALVEVANEILSLTEDVMLRAYAHLYLVFGYEGKGELQASEAAARKALEVIPESPDRQLLSLGLGRVLARLGRFDEAIDTLRSIDAALLEPVLNCEREFLLGVSYLRSGKPAEALQALESADGPALPEGRRAEVQSTRGHALFALGRAAEAAPVFEALARTAPAPLDRATADLYAARAWEAVPEPDRALAAATAVLETLAGESSEPGLTLRAGALITRARVELARRNFALATLTLDQAVLARPECQDDVHVLELRWSALMQSGRVGDAAALTEAAAARPALAGHPSVEFMRSEAARRDGQGAAAQAALRRAAEVPERFSDQASAWFASALANLGLTRKAAATLALEKLFTIDPKARNVPMVRFWSALARDSADVEAAQSMLDDLDATHTLITGPLAPLAMLARGMALLSLKRRAEAEHALAAVPGLVAQTSGALANWSAQAHFLRSSALFADGRTDDAFEALREALAVPVGPGAFDKAYQALIRLQRAELRLRLEQVESALEDIRDTRRDLQALRLQGLRSTLWDEAEREAATNEIEALLRLGRNEHALAAAERLARDATPARPLALLMQGNALMRLCDFSRALSSFIGARKHAGDSSDPPAIAMRARLEEAAARQKLGDHERAIETLQQALADHEQAATTDAWFWLLLGTSYYALDRLEPARAALERAGQLAADAEAPRSARAIRAPIALAESAVLVKLTRHDAAIRAIDAVAAPDTHASALAYNRGIACLELFRESRDAAWLLRARESFARAAAEAGDDRQKRAASDASRQLERKASPGGNWFDYWFGEGAPVGRLATGAVLGVLVACLLFGLPLLAFIIRGYVDWKLLPVPAVGALLLFLLPGIKSLSLALGDIKVSAEPVTEAGGTAAALPSLIGMLIDAAPELGAFTKSVSFVAAVAGNGDAPDSPLAQGLAEALFCGSGSPPTPPPLGSGVMTGQAIVSIRPSAPA